MIYLKINTSKGVITIPFIGLKEVDAFTVRYGNMGQLVNMLIKMLGLNIDLYDVNSVYLTFNKYNIELDEKCLPIKYRRDNFNFESLKNALASWIYNDPAIIYRTDLRYVKTREIFKYFDSGILDNIDIDRIVRAFFEDTGYKRRRDTYFLIKEETDINIKTDEIVDEVDIDRKKLSIYSDGLDDHLNYLIELSKRSEEDFARAMDEIGQHDLEEISKFLRSDGYGIVDGVSDSELLMKKDINLIEEATGLSIDKLRAEHTRFGRRRRFGR